MAVVDALNKPGPVTGQAAIASVVSSRARTAPSWNPPPRSALAVPIGIVRRDRPPAMCSTRSRRAPVKGRAPTTGPIEPGSDPPSSPRAVGRSGSGAPERARTTVETWETALPSSVVTVVSVKQSSLPWRANSVSATTSSPIAAARYLTWQEAVTKGPATSPSARRATT